MRKFFTFLLFIILFTACKKSLVYGVDIYNKRLITSEVRDKFVGTWSRVINLQMPDFVFNAKDSINPGVIKFADTIIISAIAIPIKDTNNKKDTDYYLDSLKIKYPKSPGNMDVLDSVNV